MTRPFSIALRRQVVARLTGVNAVSAAQLARETGITQQNLSRWLSEARNSPFGAVGVDIVSSWTTKRIHKLERGLARKDRALAEAATLLVLRETIGNQVPREDGVVDEQAEEAQEFKSSPSNGRNAAHPKGMPMVDEA
jgi:hypothetical protein